ncbi:MAG: TetR/AcrR family transcriptional regulator [Acidimicrobiales bacterium]
MTVQRWLHEERGELAAERILDAAAALFVERGVGATGMGDVARAAGCSRATLYRYFEGREALLIAYVHREARRIGKAVAESVAGIADSREQLVAAVLGALRRVRAEPTLAAWFTVDGAAIASGLAQSSDVIGGMVAGFLGGPADDDVRHRADWLVRVMLSLLASPGDDEDHERSMIERFVAPVVLAPGPAVVTE